ncbi:hypothetical protein, partial [Sutterella sp. KLE1602]|uniref:hypothetical protein n=1 Tax=Sutterella sp. KLE1602 TaxID=1574262 RepID=UPI001E48EBA4
MECTDRPKSPAGPVVGSGPEKIARLTQAGRRMRLMTLAMTTALETSGGGGFHRVAAREHPT